MKKQHLTIILVLAVIGIGIAIWINKQRVKRASGESTTPEPPSCPDGWEYDSEGNPDSPHDMEAVIKIGDVSGSVKYAQSRLNSQYGADLKEDGYFGCATFDAVTDLTGYNATSGFELNDLK
jgi:hypothetical protein